MAITISDSGNEMIASVGPGETASKEVAVAGMTADDEVLVTVSHTSKQDTQRNYAAQYTLQVVKEADKFTVYANQRQTPDIYFDYVVLTGTA